MQSSLLMNSWPFIGDTVLGGLFELALLDSRSGFIRCRVSGKNVKKHFRHEPGGHRWQRVPPTERRGRVHTSTITVAVLPEVTESEVKISEKDLEWKAFRGSGPGGQHRNKTDSAVSLHHKPTGIKIRSESQKSQKQNKDTALAILRARLHSEQRESQSLRRSNMRKSQVGSGMRADKIRTIRLQDGQVTDHNTGKRISAKKYLRGDLEGLFEK
jgi:peptide chain release factor 1